MQVRAVFMNCDLNDNDSTFTESERTRFTQEELYRHGSLTNCNKKLALTVKMYGETDGNFEDEYIPIEHVINGPHRRRTRLLNPYVLRLRREVPLQAYELRKIDIVNGILSNTDFEEEDNQYINRQIRNSVAHGKLKQRGNNLAEEELTNITYMNRYKREYSSDVHQYYDDSQVWIPTDNLISDINNFQNPVNEKNKHKYRFPGDNTYADRKIKRRRLKSSNYKNVDRIPHETKLDDKLITDVNVQYKAITNFTTISSDLQSKHIAQTESINKIGIIEKPYALYEIGKPDMWSTVHVQLFEKMSSPDGKTVWNDITKGELPSVSSSLPEWGNENMNIRYQNTEWVARKDFTLPTESGICLLAPIYDTEADHLVDNIRFVNGQEYFVLPRDAIITLEDSSSVMKRSNNDSDISSSTEFTSKSRRRVQIRLSRALFTGANENMCIASRGTDRFLTIPYRQPSRGQIDLEAKADGNQLITIGTSGRITTAVSDSTRPTSVALTFQLTNNGLAAARFRAIVRECQPSLASGYDTKDSEQPVTNRIMIPPKHTRLLKLQLTNNIPVDSSHCSVALINDYDEQVAVRGVTIRKGDRCFCVWHCDCVCLSEDPKLLCREMPVSRQIAAGMSSINRRRHTRSVCYNDIASIDLCITIIGVITTFLFLGLLKALIGLFVPSVRNWGLERVLETPRKLDHYYEQSLRARPVEYDVDGWPLHPDTKKRSVHLVSRPMVFILNILYFIITPCLLVRNAVKTMISLCKGPGNPEPGSPCTKDTKKCFSSHEMQSVEPRWRHRREGLRRWMTPQAEELSADVWQQALPSRQPIKCEIMQPLLHEPHYHFGNSVMEDQDSCVDSEDDTEYVLMQMQKSKASLRRCQRKLNNSDGLLSQNDSKRRDLSGDGNN